MARRPSIGVTHREFVEQAKRLRELATHIRAFSTDYQMLLSEMIALQAFYSFETAIEEIAAKIVCGALYVDGVAPNILHRTATADDAITAMRTLSRAKPKGLLKWNQGHVIVDNVKHVIAGNDNICAVCTNFAAQINEIRVVRNHIAHFNKDTRKQYVNVVSARLGATPKKLPRPGAFVLRETTPGSIMLVEFVVNLEAIVKAVAKA